MGKLNINELRIGDLVKCGDPNCKGHRVDYVHEMDNEVGVDGEILDLDMIYPISITYEILEKNNFKKCIIIKDHCIDLKMEPYKITEQLYILDGMRGVLVCDCDSGLVFIPLFECKYVHQLQHILEDSGILQDIQV